MNLIRQCEVVWSNWGCRKVFQAHIVRNKVINVITDVLSMFLKKRMGKSMSIILLKIINQAIVDGLKATTDTRFRW